MSLYQHWRRREGEGVEGGMREVEGWKVTVLTVCKYRYKYMRIFVNIQYVITCGVVHTVVTDPASSPVVF